MEITNANGITYVHNEYDHKHRVIRQKLCTGQGYVLFYGEIQINRYDAEGLRAEMEENGRLVQFLYRDKKVVLEERAEEKVRYICTKELLASDACHARTWYHYASDELGSITHVEQAGEVLNHYDYDAWGNLTACEERVENRFKFTGQQSDPISRQYYLRARYYNPVIGRFTQEDTYYEDGLNLYAYCRNNPVNYVDPSGNFCDNAAERILNLIDEGRIKGKNRSSLEKYLTENAANLTDAERRVADKLGLDVGNGRESGSKAINNVSQASPFDLQVTHSQTLSKKNMNKLIDDIKNNGINETIKYVEYNGQKYVVDGHHRLIASKRLGLEQVPIEQVELPYAGYKTVEDLLWFD